MTPSAANHIGAGNGYASNAALTQGDDIPVYDLTHITPHRNRTPQAPGGLNTKALYRRGSQHAHGARGLIQQSAAGRAISLPVPPRVSRRPRGRTRGNHAPKARLANCGNRRCLAVGAGAAHPRARTTEACVRMATRRPYHPG